MKKKPNKPQTWNEIKNSLYSQIDWVITKLQEGFYAKRMKDTYFQMLLHIVLNNKGKIEIPIPSECYKEAIEKNYALSWYFDKESLKTILEAKKLNPENKENTKEQK